jgi:dTMP kinase
VATTILQKFVVLEGLDGSGTTTQLTLLADRLAREKRQFGSTCEPTDGPVGKLLRSILAREIKAHPRTIALLYAADRSEHVYAPRTGIEARVKAGNLVICDRYIFSSLAYQAVECGLDYVMALNSAFPLPQCLIFIDTPVEVCQERLAQRGKPELYDGYAFQSRVRDGYLKAFEQFKGSGIRMHLVAGNSPAGIIHGEIWKIITGLPITGM